MTTMTSEHLSDNPGEVRRSLRNGTEVVLTFRGRPFGHVVAPERIAQLEALEAEVERLRQLVSEYGITVEARKDKEVAA